jgi:hypothetical protein
MMEENSILQILQEINIRRNKNFQSKIVDEQKQI